MIRISVVCGCLWNETASGSGSLKTWQVPVNRGIIYGYHIAQVIDHLQRWGLHGAYRFLTRIGEERSLRSFHLKRQSYFSVSSRCRGSFLILNSSNAIVDHVVYGLLVKCSVRFHWDFSLSIFIVVTETLRFSWYTSRVTAKGCTVLDYYSWLHLTIAQ